MKFLSTLLGFLRRKATGFALVAGLLTAVVCWWLLPPTPRFAIKISEGSGVPVFSPKMNYLAISTFEKSANQFTYSETTLWGIQEGRSLGSFRFRGSNSVLGDNLYFAQAFTRDETTFVEFCRGKAQYRDVVTGDMWQLPQNPHELPPPLGHFREVINRNIRQPDQDEKEEGSGLISDEKGRLNVLYVKENDHWGLRNFPSGNEFAVSSSNNYKNDFRLLRDFNNKRPRPRTRSFSRFIPGMPGMPFENLNGGNEEWEVPTGTKVFQKVRGAGFFEMIEWKITPKWKKRIVVDGKINVFDNMGGPRELNLGEDLYPILSLDGSFLLVNDQNHGPSHPWLECILQWFSNPDSMGDVVLYDLEKDEKIATFRNSQGYLFSQDNRRIAIYNGDSWNIHDLPLAKPWGKVAGYSLSVAAGVFLVGLICGFLRRKKRTLA